MKRTTMICLIISLVVSACTLVSFRAAAQEVELIPPLTIERPPTLEQILIYAARVSSYGRCVRAHESDTSGGYRAKNRTSTASGAYQMLDSTWRSLYSNLRRGPAPWAHAKDAPPEVQDLVFAAAIARGGQGHWKLTGCSRHL